MGMGRWKPIQLPMIVKRRAGSPRSLDDANEYSEHMKRVVCIEPTPSRYLLCRYSLGPP